MGINELRIAVTVVSLAVFVGIVVWTWTRRFDVAEQLPFLGEDS